MSKNAAPETEIPRAVAIVGRPNVGKSRLFNRLLGRRVAIVHDTAGVTRDLLAEPVADGGYLLMDTGGIGLFTGATPPQIAEAVEEQVGFAINAAGVVLLVVDAAAGVVPLDLEIAARLRRFGKRVILVANKADNAERTAAAQGDFFSLGLGAPALVSAEHGTGVPFLVEKIMEALGGAPAADAVSAAGGVVRLALAGRPNVGKSSLGNKILGARRLVVSDTAGTTRDPVRVSVTREGAAGGVTRFELVDTAGRRGANKRDALDFLSTLRGDAALARADVVALVLDATTGVTRLDKQLAGKVAEEGAGVVVVVNKWDIARERVAKADPDAAGAGGEAGFRRRYLEAVRRELFFLPDAPVLFLSARDDPDADALLDAAEAVARRGSSALPTGRLNKVVRELMERRPPAAVGGRRFKCYYAVHVGGRPPAVRLFCNSAARMERNYERYLLSGLRAAFDLAGAPLALRLVGKPKDPGRGFFTPPAAPDGGD